ncbi:MAG: dockerin type I domain-containing protein [Candidatus Diapherotrites archaeon]|nr:dockerin type I domain-containing protein [Candidatus Diapherotrites archaeon]
MKAIVFLFLAVAALLLFSGCVNEELNATDIVKELPEVQAFLAEHPNAEIKAIYLSKEDTATQIADIREQCGSQMKEQSYWFVEIKEGDARVRIWLDGETKNALCIIKKGKTVVEDECRSDSECNDQDECTMDSCSGTPKKCSNAEITDCKDGDGCCPITCRGETDSDCIIEIKSVILKDATTNMVLDGPFAYLDLYCSNEEGPVMSKRGNNGTFDFAVTQKCGQISVTVSANGFKTKTVYITQSTTIIYLEHAAEECDDTDNGENYYIKGETLNTEFHCEDSCQQPNGRGYVLLECVCDASAAKGAVAKPYVCPRGTCVGGICTDEPIEQTCTAECKKDGVRDEFSKGYLILTNQNCDQQIIYDECKDSEVLYERKCTSGDNFASEEIRCAYGCEGGVCSADSGVEPSKCGCADVTFDGKVDILDLGSLGIKYGTSDPLTDIDMDLNVTEFDLNCVGTLYNEETSCAGPKPLGEYSCAEADITADGKVDIFDLALIGKTIRSRQGQANYDARADITKDNWVNNIDFAIMRSHYGETC